MGRLSSVDPFDTADIDTARETAMKLESALSGEATFDAGILGLSDAQRLRLGPLFDGGIPNLRPLFPVDESGRLDRCRLPDPTFGGIVPDLTQAHFDELVGRPCNDE